MYIGDARERAKGCDHDEFALKTDAVPRKVSTWSREPWPGSIAAAQFLPIVLVIIALVVQKHTAT
jgi:hypothetical protein